MLNYYAKTITGRRKNNQDSITAFRVSSDTHFIAIADGMGGAMGGEIASNLVINQAKEILLERFSKPVAKEELKNILSEIYQKAQKVIRDHVEAKPELNGMGTTLVCVLIYKRYFVWGNLGDSRLYYHSGEKISQITTDHSAIEDLKKEKAEVSESMVKQYGHILTRSIDGGQDEPDIYPRNQKLAILPRKGFLMLCSDGLIINKNIDQNKFLSEKLFGFNTLKDSAEQLISGAYYNGSNDNISVIVIELGKMKRKKKQIKKLPFPPIKSKIINTENDHTKKKNSLVLSLLLPSLIIIIIAVGAYFLTPNYFKRDKTSKVEPGKSEETIKPEPNDPDRIVAPKEFDGFEYTKLDYFINDKSKQITWYTFTQAVKFIIKIENVKSKEVNKKEINKNTNKIQAEEIGIDKAGKYHLIVVAVTKNGNQIEGKNKLNLTIN